jgi:hypothetical protein
MGYGDLRFLLYQYSNLFYTVFWIQVFQKVKDHPALRSTYKAFLGYCGFRARTTREAKDGVAQIQHSLELNNYFTKKVWSGRGRFTLKLECGECNINIATNSNLFLVINSNIYAFIRFRDTREIYLCNLYTLYSLLTLTHISLSLTDMVIRGFDICT